jgi:hypothetical protein
MNVQEKHIQTIRQEFRELAPLLDERRVRLWCAARARAYNQEHGRGGVTVVHRATGISRNCIYAGIHELLTEGPSLPVSRVRRPGSGRKHLTEVQAGLRDTLERLVAPVTRGDPESKLRWVSKSTYHLSDALQAQGYTISPMSVGALLDELDYSLQAPSKTREGGDHPDRDAQFRYIDHMIQWFQWCGWPTLSIDAKKKENIGDFRPVGREYHPKGHPPPVRVYDFVDRRLGKVTPYGIYNMGRNQGFVNVGVSADTAEFAVNSLRKWWYLLGRQEYPSASAWLLAADGGGSNGSRTRLWKTELQQLVNEIMCAIYVCHYPPGTSKWNRIEHRMFSEISDNWRGEPLTSREVVVNRIANTKTSTGLTILAQLDERIYETGRKISDEELAAVHIERANFHGEWNYVIKPNRLL